MLQVGAAEVELRLAAGIAAGVSGSAAGNAAIVKSGQLQAKQQVSVVILRAGAVEVDYSASGKAASVELDILQAGAARVYSGSSTVLAAVTIVVEHGARLSVGRQIAGVAARSIGQTVGRAVQSLSQQYDASGKSWIAGISALSYGRWIVGVAAQSVVVRSQQQAQRYYCQFVDRRRNGTIDSQWQSGASVDSPGDFVPRSSYNSVIS